MWSATSLLTPLLLAVADAFCDVPIGTAIENAATASALLAASARIHPPGPEFEKPHFAQDIHQIKRQTMASNALSRLNRLLVGSGKRVARHEALRDPQLVHLVGCAAAPSAARADGEDAKLDEQSARSLANSLECLATICAAHAADSPASSLAELDPLREGAFTLADRAEALSGHLSLSQAVSSRWAARRLFGSACETPQLDRRCQHLPFDMLPALVALPPPAAAGTPAKVEVVEATAAAAAVTSCGLLPSVGRLVGELSVISLREGVPFEQSALLTADGRRVRERRHTAWLAEEGIGALAYSGKLMDPTPIDACDVVARLRAGLREDTGEHFDCALTNLYVSGGSAACAWHRDPEHGDAIDAAAKWARPTYVVSAGETRRFAFRRYRGEGACAVGGGGGGGPEAVDGNDRFVVSLFTGDVIAMDRHCNECVLSDSNPRPLPFAFPRLAFPRLAFPRLALPCLASPCLALPEARRLLKVPTSRARASESRLR